MLLPPRSRLGRYEIVAPLGSGGMGEVYRARDPRLERDVAIKVLPERFATDRDLKLRFEREAKAAAALSHPHICSIFDVGVEGGFHFIVMEYLDGETLADRMARGLLPLQSSIEYAVQVVDALAEAHRHGVVHRDLKPSNMMVVRSGIKLLDFGVAKFRASPLDDDGSASTRSLDTGRGVLLGTLQYMAPEQLSGRGADASADVFSVGVVLYELITGVAPFAADSRAGVIAAILDREPPPASSFNAHIPIGLTRLVADCLEKQPRRRPTTEQATERLRTISAAPDARVRPHPPHGRSKPLRSLVVMPFSTALRNDDSAAFAEGMTEGLITSLASYPSLRVISPATARRFRGSDKRPSEIGADLRVDAVLRGRIVEGAVGMLVLTLELIETANDMRLWTGEFECERAEVLNVQEQIAQAVASEIRLSATPRGTRKRRLNTESHDAYLRGKFHFDNRLGNWFESSYDALTTAISHDRTFAPAHAALCRWYVVAGLRQTAGVEISSYHVEWREACRRAEEEAHLALKLDPLLADAHSALARVLYFRWKFEESEQAFRKSLELEPGNALTHISYSYFLSLTNRQDEAILHAEIARDRDPLATYVYEQLACAFYSAKRFEKCLDACQQGLELNPSEGVFYYFRGLALGMLGRFEAAVASLAVACARMPTSPFPCCSLAAVFVRGGVVTAGLRMLDQLQREHSDPISLAEIYMALGRVQDTLSQLETAFQLETPQLLGVVVDPAFMPLFGHPRFKRLLNGLGLTRFFESSEAAS